MTTQGSATLVAQAEVAMALAEVSEGVVPSQALLDALGMDIEECAITNAILVNELPPFASIYLSQDGNIGGQSHAEIAGFYLAISARVPPNPDYLSSLLYLLGQILKKEAEFLDLDLDLDIDIDIDTPRAQAIENAKFTLVRDHLVPWLVPYLLRVEQLSGYENLAWVELALDLISSILQPEIHPSLERDLDQPTQEPIQAFGDSAEFINWVTTPALSGVIVAPADLARMARDLGLATRIGRKRFVLEGLTQQDGRAILGAFDRFVATQRDLYLTRSAEFDVLHSWCYRSVTTQKRILATLEMK